MKAKDLAEKLLEYPDFDVKIIFADGQSEGGWINYRFLKLIGTGDIGHSDKVIQIEGIEL